MHQARQLYCRRCEQTVELAPETNHCWKGTAAFQKVEREVVLLLSIAVISWIFDSSVLFAQGPLGSWTNYTPSNSGIMSGSVQSTVVDKEGVIWFGLYHSPPEGGGVSRLDDGGTLDKADDNWVSYTVTDGLAYQNVWSAAVDGEGVKWFGTAELLVAYIGGGVSVLDDKGTADKSDDNWTTYTVSDGLMSDNVWATAIDAYDNKWFGCTGFSEFLPADGGVSQLTASGNWITYTMADGLLSNALTSIAIDNQGRKWFGGLGGVSMLDDKGTETKDDDQWFTQTLGNMFNVVWAVAVDDRDVKWFGTEEGAVRFDGSRWVTYTVADGLADDVVWAVAVDERGYKWFGTSAGVSVLDDKGTAEKEDDTWRTYTTTHGLVDDSVSSINAHGSDVWIGTGQGVSRFTPWDVYLPIIMKNYR